MKVIITGATGMVGEGVLLECLNNKAVQEVLMINRRSSPIKHPRLKELLVPDFFQLHQFSDAIKGYDACFYCAGISSVGMNETKYSYITYDTTMAFANALLEVNKSMTFCFVSGSHTDSSEKGKLMWARVKGKTENALMKLPFSNEYNFRPGGMLTTPGQRNAKALYTFIVKLIRAISPKRVCTMQEIGLAMIHAVIKGYPKQVLEIADIKLLAKEE
ncbi:MAG TPA: NAD-dependent epimerase/dehydratase family protein [Chitinophagaceae bacterium]